MYSMLEFADLLLGIFNICHTQLSSKMMSTGTLIAIEQNILIKTEFYPSYLF